MNSTRYGSPRPARWTVPLGIVLLLGLLAPSVSLHVAGTSVPARPGAGLSAAATTSVDAPTLTLIPSPSTGNAPLNTSVTVAITGGVSPYKLTVCFGTADHTSPAMNCGMGDPSWGGGAPLHFSHIYTQPGSYSVTGVAVDARGAGVGSTALIIVTDLASLSANAAELTSSGNAPLTATFNESVQGGTLPITLQWLFGDGSAGSGIPGQPVVHVYRTAGIFVPQLTVTDGAGHRTVRTLAAITVLSIGLAGGGMPPWVTGPWGWVAVGAAFAVAAAVAAVSVAWAVRLRWRREGNELIESIRHGSDPSPPNRPPP